MGNTSNEFRENLVETSTQVSLRSTRVGCLYHSGFPGTHGGEQVTHGVSDANVSNMLNKVGINSQWEGFNVKLMLLSSFMS